MYWSCEMATCQNTESLSPTIFMDSLIFFSFSATTTISMGVTNWLREITRYSGMIERRMY